MFDLITQLKQLNTDRPAMDELVLLIHAAKAYRTEYDALQMEAPEWLDDSIRRLRREITARNEDVQANMIKSIDAELSKLKTPAERREELIAKRNKLVGAAAGE